LFCGETHKLLQLHIDILTIIIWITLFDEAFKNDDGAKFLGYVLTDSELLWVEFCNFVKCYIFENHLTRC
jgi:hypothetical protein